MTQGKREEFIAKLEKLSSDFCRPLAYRYNFYKGSEVLMTPATEFYRIFRNEIESVCDENLKLKQVLRDINGLSKLNKKNK